MTIKYYAALVCVFSLDAMCFGVFTIVSQSVEMTLRTTARQKAKPCVRLAEEKRVSPTRPWKQIIWHLLLSVRATTGRDGPNYKPLNRT